MSPPVVRGRAWRFADANINSDIILPSDSFKLVSEDEQARLLFGPYRPGWIDEVRQNDVIVAGKNFGTGSGRPAAALMKRVGVAAVVAESINDLFFRNCINAAVLPLECAGVIDAVSEGDIVEVDVAEGRFVNVTTDLELRGTPVPGLLLDIIAKGGLLEMLRADGYVR